MYADRRRAAALPERTCLLGTLALLALLAAGCLVVQEPAGGAAEPSASSAPAAAASSGPPGGTPAGSAPAHPAYQRLIAAATLDGSLVGDNPAHPITIAVVFASWCVHCRHELGELRALLDTEPAVRVIGINAFEEYDGRSDLAGLQGFLADSAPWLRVVRADDALLAELGAPSKIPTVYVFDAAGQLVSRFDRRDRTPPSRDELAAVVASVAR